MKVFVSTQQTQGHRPNDFSFVPEGELLIFNLLNTTCSLDPDGPCGCGRSMCGMESLKATTTMTVQELPLTADAYKTAIRESVLRSGFHPTQTEIDALYQDLTEAASFFEPGEAIEYRANYFSVRAVPEHA